VSALQPEQTDFQAVRTPRIRRWGQDTHQSAEMRWGRGGSPIATTMRGEAANATPIAPFAHICTANASAAARERRRCRRRGHPHGWQPAAARPYAPAIGLAAGPCRGGGRSHGSHTTLATAVIAQPVRDGSGDGGGGDRGGAGDPAADAGEARTSQRRVQAGSTARLNPSVGPELALSAAIDHADSGLATREMKLAKS